MSNKLIDNKRRNHAEKILHNASKQHHVAADSANQETPVVEQNGFKDQYEIIKNDLVQLRTDLMKGYDMAKVWMEKKGSVRELLRTR